uniref:Uncharacterized protein n=1 Tax=Romanomermis culicivorax TaxID=13658 RepID=A0A915K5Q6_ROMCU
MMQRVVGPTRPPGWASSNNRPTYESTSSMEDFIVFSPVHFGFKFFKIFTNRLCSLRNRVCKAAKPKNNLFLLSPVSNSGSQLRLLSSSSSEQCSL